MGEKATGYDGIAMANFSLMANLLCKIQEKRLLSHTEVLELVEGPMRVIEGIRPQDRDGIARATYAALEQLLAIVSQTYPSR